jgi:hypothetical protein
MHITITTSTVNDLAKASDGGAGYNVDLEPLTLAMRVSTLLELSTSRYLSHSFAMYDSIATLTSKLNKHR